MKQIKQSDIIVFILVAIIVICTIVTFVKNTREAESAKVQIAQTGIDPRPVLLGARLTVWPRAAFALLKEERQLDRKPEKLTIDGMPFSDFEIPHPSLDYETRGPNSSFIDSAWWQSENTIKKIQGDLYEIRVPLNINPGMRYERIAFVLTDLDGTMKPYEDTSAIQCFIRYADSDKWEEPCPFFHGMFQFSELGGPGVYVISPKESKPENQVVILRFPAPKDTTSIFYRNTPLDKRIQSHLECPGCG